MPYTQDQINKGQTYVNFELVRVDEKVINIIQMLVDMLKQTRALPASAASSNARQINVDTIEAAITEVATISSKVAGIKPPGCEPPPPPPPGYDDPV